MTAVRFDMRHAPFSPHSLADQYRECVSMTRWADEHGFSNVTISEHHGVDFISAPLALAGALLGATERIRLMVGALLLPLHDPIRLAEEIATLDLASGGRFTIVAGIGYRPEEFEMAGIDSRRRGALAEEWMEVLIQAWTGEPFEWQGRRIVVTPVPASPPSHLMWAGGSVRASAERAARLRLPFYTMSTNPELREIYQAACEDEGYRDGFFLYPSGPSFVHVTEDPERTWDEIARYALYDVTSYRSWQHGGHDNAVAIDAESVEDLKASGLWQVVTPEQCVELAAGIDAVALHPLMGGMPFELGWSSLQLYVDRVLPLLD